MPSTETEHMKNLEKGDKLAQFIQNQHFTKELFELRHKAYGLGDEDEEDEKYSI